MPAALNTAMIAESRRWANVRPGQACSSADSSPLVKTGTSFWLHPERPEPRHRVGKLLLVRPPPEELLQRPVLVAGAGVAVAAQQPDHPALDILRAGLVPVRAAGLPEKVSGGEPLDRLGVHAHRLGRLALGSQVKPERADYPLEHPCGERLRLPGTLSLYGHSFPLFLRRARTGSRPRPAFPQVRGLSGQGRGRTRHPSPFRRRAR